MALVTSTDGTPIAVWRSGTGPPLLLVHGTTSNHTTWAQVLPGFERDFTVYTLNRRGYAPSGDAEVYSLAQEARDLAAVVDWIGQPVSLLGHSFGATCCLEAALLTPHLRTLILYEPAFPGAGYMDAETLARLETLIQRDDREGALVLMYREVAGVPESMLDQMRNQPGWDERVASAPALVRESHAERAYRPDIAGLRTIQTPALHLVGGDSPAWAHQVAQQLDDLLPNSRIRVIPGQQHLAHRSAPDEFVAAVRTFLQA